MNQVADNDYSPSASSHNFYFPDLDHLDTDQALGSLDRIVELDADLMLPGHGAPWAGSPAVTLVRA